MNLSPDFLTRRLRLPIPCGQPLSLPAIALNAFLVVLLAASSALAGERFGVDVPPNHRNNNQETGSLSPSYTRTNNLKPKTQTDTRVQADTSSIYRVIPQKAFVVGERIVLSVRYMGIPCGELAFTVAEQTTYRNRPVYIVHVHAYTNRAFSQLFYEISDTLTSYIDAEGLFSWKYIKEIHENAIHKDREDTVAVFEYDQEKRLWSHDGVVKGEILPFTQDLLSVIYYLRAIEWKDGMDTIRAPLNDTKRNYQMSFGLGKRRILPVLADKVHVRVGQPTVELDGKYKLIGNNELWFTDDARRIPVLVKSHIRLGHLYAKLVEYSNGSDTRLVIPQK